MRLLESMPFRQRRSSASSISVRLVCTRTTAWVYGLLSSHVRWMSQAGEDELEETRELIMSRVMD